MSVFDEFRAWQRSERQRWHNFARMWSVISWWKVWR